ncbi:hypothetical protein [Myxococcus sp. CA040A]|uniref:hypothetical protein n=1 Tax=Myxococcus sp. CA040A TaxID=2741738 RepID=UPI00157ADF04|nr:hypothetical protein [Myxococcus sp. CA040A]NTX08514.1 hypothetical protein [Myxococcus sp. CA040A]
MKRMTSSLFVLGLLGCGGGIDGTQDLPNPQLDEIEQGEGEQPPVGAPGEDEDHPYCDELLVEPVKCKHRIAPPTFPRPTPTPSRT